MIVDRNIDDLIVRYYYGTLDDRGAETLSAWVLSDEANARVFKSRLKALRHSGQTTSQAAGFLAKITKKQSRTKLTRNFAVSFAVLGLAAVAVLLSGGNERQTIESHEVPTILLPTAMNSMPPAVIDEEGVTETVTGHENAAGSSVSSRKFVAPKDRIMSLTLDDGTDIILNKGTKLSVDADFGRANRTVRLDGEAFFKVAKDPSRPFCISCRDESYIVHGTSFNIQSYLRDGYSMVTLHSGSLEARVKGSKIMLDPGDELFVDESEDNFTKKKVNTAYSSMWINEGTLHFSGLALKYVAAQLSHKYGVNVSVHSSVADIIYEGEIDNEPLETALKLISISSPTSLKITNLDGEYYITKL